MTGEGTMPEQPRKMRPPSQIFREKILPAFQEYLAEPGSVRRANILALALNDQLEWTFQYHQAGDVLLLRGARTLKEFRNMIYGLCPELRMMKDLADADKHRELRPNPNRLVVLSTKAYSKKGKSLWVTGYDKAFWPAAEAAVQFWREWAD
jgi:hypothetical protein